MPMKAVREKVKSTPPDRQPRFAPAEFDERHELAVVGGRGLQRDSKRLHGAADLVGELVCVAASDFGKKLIEFEDASWIMCLKDRSEKNMTTGGAL
jgi:hypothetical protein